MMSPQSRAVGRLRRLHRAVLSENRRREFERSGCPVTSGPILQALEPRLLLATHFLVDSLGDDLAVDGAVTLREAIEAANTNAPAGDAPAGDPAEADVITFDGTLSGGTIALGGSQLAITEDLVITGLGVDWLTVDGGGTSRVFDVGSGADVSIAELEITGGLADNGGGIRSAGVLSLSAVRIAGNQATSNGGGIYNSANLTVDDSTVVGNAAAGNGGGIRNVGAGAVLVVTDSLLAANQGAWGGGLQSESGSAKVINSTVSGNTATSESGGIRVVSGTLDVVQSTVTANDAPAGGGVTRTGGTVTLDNSIVAGNTAAGTGPDVKGTFAAAGDYNVIGMIDGSTNLSSANTQYGTAGVPLDAMLGLLGDHGGPTETHVPFAGSPAEDSGDNARALDELGSPLADDQRGAGFTRILNGTVDVGAVEGPRAVALSLIGPTGGYQLGQTIPISWAPEDVPANSKISLYYDPDAVTNGNEVWIVNDLTVPDTGIYNGWIPVLLPGNYYVGGQVVTPASTTHLDRLAGAITLTVGGTTYTVDSDEDLIAVDGLLTLREAIEAANSNAPVGDAPAGTAGLSDLIQFAPAMSGETIVLDGSALEITDDLLLTGLGRDVLTVNADARSGVFTVIDPTPGDPDPVGVLIAGLKITNGDSADDGGGIFNAAELHLAGVWIVDNTAFDDGGGIYNTGPLRITDSILSENSTNGSADPSGGGIYNAGGSVQLENVEVNLNVAYNHGGGILNASGDLEATGLTASQNMAFASGGALYLGDGSVTIEGATITENTGFASGGGFWVAGGSLSIDQGTIERNSTVTSPGGGGGGGLAAGSVLITDSTVSDNSALVGGGLYGTGGTLTLVDTTISGHSTSGAGGGIWMQDGTVTLTGVTVSGNEAVGGGGGARIYNCTLTVSDSDFLDNLATGSDVSGGGLYYYGLSLNITGSRFVGNRLTASNDGWGGGLYVQPTTAYNGAAYPSISETTISGNELSAARNGYGGGMYLYLNTANYGTDLMTIARSTVSGNTVYGASISQGGGIYANSRTNYTRRLYIQNTTISGNEAYGAVDSQAGGLYANVSEALYLTNTTIAGNEAAYGGGVNVASGSVRLRNTIVAGNEAEFDGPDVRGAFHTDSASSLIGIADGSTGLTGDPTILYGTGASPLSAGLGALADNGGPTLTHLLLTGSPAVDAGNDALAIDRTGAALATDQRLLPRIDNGTVDMGAVEGHVPMTFTLSGPTGDIQAGEWQTISWTQASLPATAKLSFYADPDGVFDGNEHWLLEGADPNAMAGQWLWPAVDGIIGPHTIGAIATDSVTGAIYTDRLGATTTVLYDFAYVVDSLGDSTAADGLVTLREAVEAANLNLAVGDAHPGRSGAVDMILFHSSLTGGQIDLALGQLAIDDDLAILGLGEDDLSVSGVDADRIFDIGTGVNVRLSGLTIRDGNTAGDGGGIRNAGTLRVWETTVRDSLAVGDGGGVYNSGVVHMSFCTLLENGADGSGASDGGGLYNAGRAEVADSLFEKNAADTDGGGIAGAGPTWVTRVDFQQNAAFDDGGAVASWHYLRLIDSTLGANVAYDAGGGLYVQPNAPGPLVRGSGISGNASATGAGVRNDGYAVYLFDSTVANNLAGQAGGGIWNGTVSMVLRNVSVVGNTAGAAGGGVYDDDGTLQIDGSDLVGNTAGAYGGGIWKDYGTVKLTGVTVADNEAVGRGGGAWLDRTWLTIADSTFSNNAVSGGDVYGGGLYYFGYTLSITGSEFVDNRLTASNVGAGGGLYLNASTEYGAASYPVITDTTVAGNELSASSEGYGGGLYLYINPDSYGTVLVTIGESTFSGNSVYGASVSRGGALYTTARTSYTRRLDIINTTISGNRAYGAASAGGGGVYSTLVPSVYFTQATVTLNESAYGGGIQRESGDVRVRNTIVAGNEADFDGPDVYGDFHADSAYDLIGVIDGSTGLGDASILSGTSAAPLWPGLGALADNGGPTRTHILLSTSPALNGGSNSLVLDQGGNPITSDQRGGIRILGGTVDMGAVEGSLPEAFVLSGPTGPILAGEPQIISWPSESISATALLTIYADPDGLINGNEIELLSNADPNVLAGQWTWYAVDVPAGAYTIGATAFDPSTGLALTDRLAAPVVVSLAGAYVVDSLLDVVGVDGVLTLREAIDAARTNLPAGDAVAGRDDAVDIITFAPGLATEQIDLLNGQLPIEDDLCIQGLGSGVLAVASNGTDRIFHVEPGVLAWISGLRLTGGYTTGDGGAVLNAGELVLSDVDFVANSAYDDGGAIANTGTLRGSDLGFVGNSVSGSTAPAGGAIYNAGLLTLTDSLLDQNTAVDDGGALYVASRSEATLERVDLTDNEGQDGGAIYSAGLVKVTDGTFVGNDAAGAGGGIAIGAGAAQVYDSEFTSNTAVGSGGGLWSAGASLFVQNTEFTSNAAGGSGAGLADGSGTTTLRDMTFTNNTASGSGGGLYDGSGNLTVETAVFTGNAAGSSGGGLYNASGTLTIADADFLTNTAGGSGGGIYSYDGALNIEDTTVSGNTAGSDGGGIWKRISSMNVTNLTVSGNAAAVRGGGVYADNVYLTMVGTQVLDNTLDATDVYGGGLYSNNSEKFQVTGSRFEGNRATGSNRAYGGAIYAVLSTPYGGTDYATLTECTIADNELWGGSEAYGGGAYLYLNPDGYGTMVATLRRSTVSGNRAYGASISLGGGVYVSARTAYGRRLDVINSTISDNRAYGAASSSGGGAYLTSTPAVYFTQATITLNQASHGGGVYRNDGTVRVRNTIVAGNAATLDGTDVYGDFHAESGGNLIGVIDGSTSLDGESTQFGTLAVPLHPRLGTLGDNGGPTLTHPLLFGSPAANAGDNNLARDEVGNGLIVDQRGGTSLRIIDGTVDVGAYEGWADTYFSLLSPSGGSVAASWATPIRWTGNVPTTSLISLYYDTDGSFNGNETYIFQDRSYPPLGETYLWESIHVPEDTYVVGALVNDPVSGLDWDDRTPSFNLIRVGVPTVYIVDTIADVIGVDGVTSLREALQAANTNLPAGDAPAGDPVEIDIIQIDPTLVGQTITLTGPLAITNHVRIEGVGTGDFRTTVDADGTGPVFTVDPGVAVQMSFLRLTGGLNGGAGGGILNSGSLLLEDMEVFGNVAETGGGLANSQGSLTASRLWIHDNTATGGSAAGGGLASEFGRTELLDSTVSGNTAIYGGGLFCGSAGELIVSNSTVSNNLANGSVARGGGVYVSGFLAHAELYNTTVTANTAAGASAAGGGVTMGTGDAGLVNTLVAANTAPTNPDVQGVFLPGSDYNLLGAIDGSVNLDGPNALYGTAGSPLNPLLGALADNGGPTPTHAVLTGSLAINGGDDGSAVDPDGSPLLFDQRGTGYDRVRNGRSDIGAFEYDASPSDNQPPAVASLGLSGDPIVQNTALTLTASGVSDDHGVVAVTFFRDANGDGIGQPGEQLGVDIDDSDGWSWTGLATWAPGQWRYLAQATDDGWPLGVQKSDFTAAIGTVLSPTAPSIVVGTHNLRAGQANQQVEIYVSGLDKVTGFNLRAQLGDGRLGAPEPVFQSVDFTGGIWDAYPNASPGGVIGGDEQLIQASVIFNNSGDEVLADGLLCTLTIDTTGFPAGGTFDLKLRIDESGSDSHFIVYGGAQVVPTVTHGSIQLFDASVVGRYVFYNGSSWDWDLGADTDGDGHYDPGEDGSNDDNAVATDKTPLLPEATAVFANYTSYSRGTNGVMIDLQGLTGPVVPGDLEFRVGNDSNPGGWPLGPAPVVTTRAGQGDGGSDRVTITWADGVIRGQWVQVRVKAAGLGLAQDDLFYVGNAVGESGNSVSNAFVDGFDVAGPRDHFRNFLNPAPINDAYDYNRDRLVDGTDMAIARDNATNFLTALRLITTPVPPPSAPAAPASASAVLGTASGASGDGPAADDGALLASLAAAAEVASVGESAIGTPLTEPSDDVLRDGSAPVIDALQFEAIYDEPAPADTSVLPEPVLSATEESLEAETPAELGTLDSLDVLAEAVVPEVLWRI